MGFLPPFFGVNFQHLLLAMSSLTFGTVGVLGFESLKLLLGNNPVFLGKAPDCLLVSSSTLKKKTNDYFGER